MDDRDGPNSLTPLRDVVIFMAIALTLVLVAAKLGVAG